MIGRDTILDNAKALVTGDRDKEYGSAFDNFNDIARGWSIRQAHNTRMSYCMSWVKIARLVKTPSHIDSWTDLAGYAGLGGEIGSIDASTKIEMARKGNVT